MSFSTDWLEIVATVFKNNYSLNTFSNHLIGDNNARKIELPKGEMWNRVIDTFQDYSKKKCTFDIKKFGFLGVTSRSWDCNCTEQRHIKQNDQMIICFHQLLQIR